ncbi:GAF and ANTAR domain-containing protein [Jiangella mangrovi]|uniref:GAF domain-containing protein n=1 Tax=Jiangella mangrovi TaxID=1524084 RepID=A0A7W9GSE5_9ACTN|nr:GAF and ANTAR domain-containing protein [Jiangella mangrovi]MBB5788866.1 GAF domain-containing protein [Jiangella mangrovi]
MSEGAVSGELGSGDFATIAAALHDAPDPEQTLELVVDYARQAVACTDAGLVLLSGSGRLESAVVTQPRVRELALLQASLEDGPALRAMQHRSAVVVGDTGADTRWPHWGAAATERGLRSAVAVPLVAGEAPFGALSLYSTEPGAFDEDDAAVAEIFARHASVAVATARDEAGLRRAMDAHHAVGLAQGVLMERYGLDAERAFAVLNGVSRRNRIKLRDAAEQVVTTARSSPEP